MNGQVVIYHNPRCSKSRATLKILQAHGIQPKIIEYLKTPLSRDKITNLITMLNISPRNLLRKGESVYKVLDLENKNINDANIISAIADNPILMERPIVVNGGKAKIGRPPEQVLELF
jgi:arsenate reductase